MIGTVATGLEAPWGIDFLPDGSALVTERDSGRILRVHDGKADEVGRIDETVSGVEAGLLGLVVSPSYAQDRRIFVYTSTDDDNRVLRMTYADGRLGAPRAILTGIPRGQIHDGGRMEFGPDGALYVATGETGDGPLAQDPGTTAGKILRITQDGDPAPGNPDPSSPVWTLGHRNVQGLAFDQGGNLWASEFGQNTWDELNLIEKGTNYGWPEVEGRGQQDRYRNPQQVWETSKASPSGLAFAEGRLWMASLRGERLWRIDVTGARATNPKGFFVGKYGRMRTVVVAPDRNLWVTTSNTDGRGDPQAGDDRILLVDPGTS
ncbi:PQQ-dependent sugar dehydrogenase [Nocardioides marmoriginsengisoli]|uniref:PQQ-dependent sugar dehydrogenase n=1 Tax=Nocardioides marmoriginsengisoli TaxID=661483 RepID=A0A3N0CPY3_9ACTN|nr:PQQ-dependent sugar dehydrogenase [Nocardioides marmoriginsengisoli]